MLVIRKEQMQVLSAAVRRSFENRMVKHLRRTCAAELEKSIGPGATDEMLRGFIGEGIRQAARHGIEAERDVARFIEVQAILGPDFDNRHECNWIRRILIDKSLSGRGKVELIHQRLVPSP